MTKALVVAPQPFFSERGTPFSVYYRTQVTAQLGVDVDLLTYGEGEDVDIPRVRIIRIPAFKFLGPVRIGPSYKKLFFDVFLMLWTIGLLLRRRYDFVHAHEESVFFLRALKPLFGFKLVYDMHSSLPEQLTNYRFTRSRAMIGAFEHLESWSLRGSDAVITISPALAEKAKALMDQKERHFLIENSIFEPVKLVKERSRRASVENVNVPSDRDVVFYAGTFEAYQGLDLLLQAFAKVRDDCPRAFLLMVGGLGTQLQKIRKIATELGLENDCLILPRMPQSAAQQLMSASRVVVSPRTAGTNTPLKIYQILGSGVPLLATRISSHTQVLSDECAILVEPDTASMANGLHIALTDDEVRHKVSSAAKTLCEVSYSRSAYEAKMSAMLESLSLATEH